MVRYLLITAMAFFLAAAAPAGTAVVRVNGTPITQAEFDLTREAMAVQMGLDEGSAELAARSALDQLIARVLLIEAAREAGIEVPDAVVESEMQQQIAQMGGREAFQTILVQSGLTEADVRRAQKERMMMMGFLETVVMPQISVSEEAAQAFWAANPDEFRHPEQVRLWTLLVDAAEDMPEAAHAEARKKAETARQRVLDGEEFETVAREVSDDPSKERGGLIGWVRRGLLLPALEEPVFGLGKGELSEVLPSDRGYHLFRVEDRRGDGVYPFEEIREPVKDILRQQRIGEAVNAEIRQRRQRAAIEVLDESLKPLVQPPGAEATER